MPGGGGLSAVDIAATAAPAPAAPSRRLRLLMELRPCFDGYAGIPQETRLLFGAFAAAPQIRLGGLLNGGTSMGRIASPPTRDAAPRESAEANALFAQTERLIALDSAGDAGARRGVAWQAVRRLLPRGLIARLEVLAQWGATERLDGGLDPALFDDWLWTRLFRLGLPPTDRALLGRAAFPVPRLSWGDAARLASLAPGARPQLNMAAAGWDVHLAHTPCPYKLNGGKLVVRYHDAIPLLWPHTISHAGAHARGHFRMLQANVAEGAWFVCTSDPVRDDLLRLFPQAEARTTVIPTMSAGTFAPDPRPAHEIASIIGRGSTAAAALLGARAGGDGEDADPSPRSRNAASRDPSAPEQFDEPFVLAVSTLEPRKNYGLLMRAAAAARRGGAKLRLVVVASPGWRSEAEVKLLKRLVAEGVVRHLADVPAADLRALYTAAQAVVCPSRAEGFDLATVEAMACGTPLLASDIPVHRWVCGDAAEYFDPYDEKALADLLTEIAALPRREGRLAEMGERSLRRAALYRPEVLVPKWEATLERVSPA